MVFDNIIFSLQKTGGISVVWEEILKRVNNISGLEKLFLEYNNIKFLATLCEKYNWKLTVARLNYIGNGKNYTKDNLKNMIEIVNQLNNEGFDIKISNCIAFCQLEDNCFSQRIGIIVWDYQSTVVLPYQIGLAWKVGNNDGNTTGHSLKQFQRK